MSSTIYLDEANLLPGKTADFAVVTDTAPRSFYVRQTPAERTEVTDKAPFDEKGLHAFHEEFKSLVLADEELFEIDWATELCNELDNLSHLKPRALVEEVADPSVTAPVVVKATAPQQVVRPLAGPQPGTPMPIETWVVKVIAVLVALNLLFAGMIVAGVRLSDLFK